MSTFLYQKIQAQRGRGTLPQPHSLGSRTLASIFPMAVLNNLILDPHLFSACWRLTLAGSPQTPNLSKDLSCSLEFCCRKELSWDSRPCRFEGAEDPSLTELPTPLRWCMQV